MPNKFVPGLLIPGLPESFLTPPAFPWQRVLWGACLGLVLGFGLPENVKAQTGNFSDITGPNNVDLGTTTSQELSLDLDRNAFEAQVQLADSVTALELQHELQVMDLQQQLGDLVELSGRLPTANEIARILRQLFQRTQVKSIYIQYSSQTTQTESFVVVPAKDSDISRSLQQLQISHFIPDFSLLVEQTKAVFSQSKPASKAILAQSEDSPILPTDSPQNFPKDDFIARYTIVNAPRRRLLPTVEQFTDRVMNPEELNQQPLQDLSQQLYAWLIEPIEPQLQQEAAETLVFSMDSGLRSLPIAALYDGEQFLIEKYAIAIVPTFGLADVGYLDVRQKQVLAMGAETFRDQNALPGVPIEVNTIQQFWSGWQLLNQDFTLDHFIEEYESFPQKPGIIHLATHGEFKPGNPGNSYIQFVDRRVSMPEFRQLVERFGWNTVEQAPELLVLSACRTAVGDEGAELGFAGLAVQSGAKSALASLWSVSDLGTLALMSEFYEALKQNPIKAQALRQAQLNLLRKRTKVEAGTLHLASGRTIDLPPSLAPAGAVDFSHPYYWSGFTLIGNWN